MNDATPQLLPPCPNCFGQKGVYMHGHASGTVTHSYNSVGAWAHNEYSDMEEDERWQRVYCSGCDVARSDLQLVKAKIVPVSASKGDQP